MIRRFFAAFTAAFMVAVGLVVTSPAQPVVAAPPGSAFDPGNIISDSVFYDFGSMSVDDIQGFLDSKVTDCRAEDPAIDCLKNIKVDIPETPATEPNQVGPCSAIPAKEGASAAEVIFAVSNACGINPQVLIVKLQKEQALVTSSRPTEYMYRAAMGYGCPDSDPAICGKVYVGLFNQLYRAARQLQWYGDPGGSFTYWKPGTTISVRYSRDSKCGVSTFELKNQATAALYYYTPYTPNAAALNNLYGTGDRCSEYGNRNFWRIFHDWFGSPVAGGYLVRAEGTSEVYLITDKAKYLISDTRLVAAYEPLGPVGDVSKAYLDSFQDMGIAPQIAVSPGGDYFLIAGAKRHKVNSCTLLREFELSCKDAIPMGDWQLKLMPLGRSLTQVLQAADGALYWVEDGTYNLLPFEEAITEAGAGEILPTRLELSHLITLKPGTPKIPDGLAFGITGTDETALSFGGRAYRLSGELAKAIQLEKWFDVIDANVDPLKFADAFAGGNNLGVVRNNHDEYFLLSNSGRFALNESSELRDLAVFWPSGLVEKLPLRGQLGDAAVLQLGSRSLIVEGGERRTIQTTLARNLIMKLLQQGRSVSISKSLASTIDHLGNALAPGLVVREARTQNRYLVDGLSSLIPIGEPSLVRELSTRELTFGKSSLAGYTLRAPLSGPKISCEGESFLLISGELIHITEQTARDFPGEAYELKNSTCHAIGISKSAMGPFLIDSKGNPWALLDGKRWLLTSDQYRSLRSSGNPGFKVSDYFFEYVPSGGKASADFRLSHQNVDFEIASFSVKFDMAETDPKAIPFDPSKPTLVPDPIPGAEPTPDPTPTPTAEPDPTPDPTPEGSGESESPASQQNTYVVQPGDTLLKIAVKFGTTVNELVKLNKLRNPDSIKVGQVLIIAEQSAPAPTPEQSQPVYYTVVAGDTLLKIAKKFGVSLEQLAKANKITNPNKIKVGQRLVIPTGEFDVAQPEPEPATVQLSYTVQPGDTLWAIARKFNVSATKLAQLNGINNSNFIQVGQVLKIPS